MVARQRAVGFPPFPGAVVDVTWRAATGRPYDKGREISFFRKIVVLHRRGDLWSPGGKQWLFRTLPAKRECLPAGDQRSPLRWEREIFSFLGEPSSHTVGAACVPPGRETDGFPASPGAVVGRRMAGG